MEAKQQLLDKITAANNILLCVDKDPTVDELSALIAFSLVLNKLGKHCAAVFSGQVPSNIQFLHPDKTLQKTTDSLRDFIIAIDKNKADKLRYKVENNVVRIYITPYREAIGQEDLVYSQGEFNVDLIIALGVKSPDDVDQAILEHGNILHDATVASICINGSGGLGSIAWHKPNASSLCEVVTEVAEELESDLIDKQIATALLTGIVSQTERFSNAKTTAETMKFSSILLSYGANQQLVSEKLNEPVHEPVKQKEPEEPKEQKKDQLPQPSEPKGHREVGTSHHHRTRKQNLGELDIEHDPLEDGAVNPAPEADEPDISATQNETEEIVPEIPTEPSELPEPTISSDDQLPDLGTQNQSTDNDTFQQPTEEPTSDPLLDSIKQEDSDTMLPTQPVTDLNQISPSEHDPDSLDAILSRDEVTDGSAPTPALTPPPADWMIPPANSQPIVGNEARYNSFGDEKLSQIEQEVNSPHIEAYRDQINDAINTPDPTNVTVSPMPNTSFSPIPSSEVPNIQPPAPTGGMPDSMNSTLPPTPPAPGVNPMPLYNNLPPTAAPDPTAAPPVPPPIPMPLYNNLPPTPPPPAQ